MKANSSADVLARDSLRQVNRELLAAFFELTKPRITLLVVCTTAAGFYLGSREYGGLLLLLQTLIGTALTSGGAACLNQLLERDADAKMRRTLHRPLPAGRLKPGAALVFGVALILGGCLYLWAAANLLAASLALLTAVIYVLIYTPLKTRTVMCTTVGAFPGALPPLIGWAAVQGTLDLKALILFAIMFIWQFPHFLAISWLYKDDYRRGGFTMLPIVDPDGTKTAHRILGHSILLVGLSIAPYLAGLSGHLYLVGAAAMSGAFLYYAIRLVIQRSEMAAQHVFRASIAYLPLLLILMAIDKV